MEDCLKSWDYEQSVNNMKSLIYRWKSLNQKMVEKFVEELRLAREILTAQGRRSDLRTKIPKLPNFFQYCKDIGSNKRSVNNWLKWSLEGKSLKSLPAPLKNPAMESRSKETKHLLSKIRKAQWDASTPEGQETRNKHMAAWDPNTAEGQARRKKASELRIGTPKCAYHQKTASPSDDIAMRECLGCEQMFKSWGKGNRVCSKCKQ